MSEGALGGGGVPKLDIRDLCISYADRKTGKTVRAVEGVDISLANKPGVGELAVLLGPSGCGKSTILRAICGLLEPDSGTILLDGQPVSGTGRDRGMVFQSYTSFAWLTVRKNVEYGLKLQGVPREQREQQAMEILQQVGLKDFADAYPKQLSGGMKQRVAIARTLVNKPKLLLMDEPFGALDPQTRWGMQALILDVLKKQDNTVVFVTHDISEAVFLGDSIFVLSHRPAKVLHRVEVPYFQERDPAVKQSASFKQVESHLLDILQSLEVRGNVRVGL
ncbi:MAG TPA: ABC transporter ATP-binding protein [Myxococcales bacterium]|jgi:ABC-type nitrate/sulfonate/bicarbonate transport system ATPase subunit|nr:ABC transporter ATP-binding protein [Myxococcales bacterium]